MRKSVKLGLQTDQNISIPRRQFLQSAIAPLGCAPAIHAKVTVADGRRLYLGSANFTPTSLDENREIGLLLADPAAAELVSATVADDAARGVGL
jgi:phosphatidylserine/phosphatidylglycerophosphate/cardiolipin synthase-like enzyme